MDPVGRTVTLIDGDRNHRNQKTAKQLNRTVGAVTSMRTTQNKLALLS